jgi:hypothetical protein
MANSSAITLGSLTRLLYTHNPFYLVSALLVLVGLHEALFADRSVTGGWLMMGVLCGYTLLLVVAGCTIIRCGQVWEDARMILLVIVLLLVALSVSFDTLLLANPRLGARFLLLGLAFSISVCEGVFRGLRIRLRAAYRAPYYLLLALLFAYPWMLAQLSWRGQDAAMQWGVFLFPAVAALVFLTLWPAARTPGREEPASGTPWSWPLFPWTLFVFLLLAVGLRSYSLAMAFEAGKGSAVGFRPYFLSPLVLVTALLLLEMGLASRHLLTQAVALLLPVVVLALGFPGSQLNYVAVRFLYRLVAVAGSPAQLAIVGAGAFYAFAWLRGLKLGEIGLLVGLALASVVDEWTFDFDTFSALRAGPLLLIAAWQLPAGLLKRSSWRVLVGAAAAALASSLGSGGSDDSLPVASELTEYVAWHALAVAILALAAIYNDRWARAFRGLMLPVVPAAALLAATAYEFLFPEVPRLYHALYIAALASVAFLYWRRSPAMLQFTALLATIAALPLLSSRGLFLVIASSRLEKGLPWLAAGMLVLAVAMLLSLSKAGLMKGAAVTAWKSMRALHRE